MTNESNNETISLKEWMTERFDSLKAQLAEVGKIMISREVFDAWCARMILLETKAENHNLRLGKVERSVYVIQLLVMLLLPIVSAICIALVVAWLTGQMTINFTK